MRSAYSNHVRGDALASGAGATLFEAAWPEAAWPEAALPEPCRPELGGPEPALLELVAAGSAGLEVVDVDVAIMDSSDSVSNETRMSTLGTKMSAMQVKLLMKMAPERTNAVVLALEEFVK